MGRISDLPLCIIENILCHLPYEDLIRTSILSKEWRYRWTKISKIVVIVDTNQRLLLKPKQEEKQEMIKLTRLMFNICQTLLRHEGPIREFNLSLNDRWGNLRDIDYIISHLSSKTTVKKMILDNKNKCIITCLPLSSLLSMSELTYLYVKHWYLGVGPTSSSPKHGTLGLTYLYVQRSYFSATTLLHLLSKCPLLKTLVLTGKRNDDWCGATIPNLEDYTDIWMEHLSQLEITCISSNQTELDIMKLILMRSLVLKYFRIFISNSNKDE